MTQFQILWQQGSEKISPARNKPRAKQSEEEKEKEDSTVKTAEKLSTALGHKLPRSDKKKAGNLVHYGFGTAMGGMYGLFRETAPASFRRMNPALLGAGYGTAVFLGAHDLVVPILGLGSNPLKEPLPDQLSEYLAHLVFGVATSLTYRVLGSFDRIGR